jgi:hypothetical protein
MRCEGSAAALVHKLIDTRANVREVVAGLQNRVLLLLFERGHIAGVLRLQGVDAPFDADRPGSETHDQCTNRDDLRQRETGCPAHHVQ